MGETTLRAARFAAKHEQILEAARTVFLHKGYARAGMDDVAAAASVSTATLYRHFQSKERLFADVVAAGLRAMDAVLPPPGGDPLSDLRSVSVAYAELLAQPDVRRLMRMLIAETGDGGPMALAFYGSVKQTLSDRFVACLETGIRAGCLADIPATERSAIAGQLQGMIEHATLLRGLVLGDDADLGDRSAPDIAHQAVDTWLAQWSGRP
ncbi:MAG: TetR/AcrR family transcriptional regulator [Pseudomonadota bacterium]